MKKTFKTITKILAAIIFITVISFIAYENRWQFQKSVPVEQYPEYIIGSWQRQDGVIVRYTDEGRFYWYSNQNELENNNYASPGNWEIRNTNIYMYEGDVSFFYTKKRIYVLNSSSMLLVSTPEIKTYYSRVE